METDVLGAGHAWSLAGRAAGGLRAAGARAGDRLGVVLPASGDLLGVVLGALGVGVVPVLVDPGSPAGEIGAVLADADPVLVLTGPEDVARLLDAEPTPLAEVPLARPMHYTSGTTGRRKGVWSGGLSLPDAQALVEEERALWGFCAEDVHLVLSPLHHSAPLRFALGTLLAGGTVVVPGPFDAARAAAAITAHLPTTTFCVPTHLQRFFAHNDDVGWAPDLTSFRLVAHAGAPCPEPVKRRALAEFPRGTVWEFYGSTEGQLTACRGEDWLERPGTVGRARPGRILSVDADRTVWCSVPAYARFSYWRDEERTAAAWRETPSGPAFTVGDHGRIDEDGWLWLDGRREDLLITGGVNVYPLEVEQVLADCPGVLDVAVFGVDDERWGQRVCAAVVGPVTPSAVTDWARQHLGPAKRPKDVYVVEALPRTSSGKVQRLRLPAALGLPSA